MIEPGTSAPQFSLPNHLGETVSLESLEGRRVLLYWYPRADTPGCAAQAQGIRDQQESFDEHECTVLGASFDEPAANAAFHEKYNLTFDLLSDVDKSVGVSFGVADGGDAEYAHRIGYLIGRDGNVVANYDVEAPEFFAEQVLDDLEELDD